MLSQTNAASEREFVHATLEKRPPSEPGSGLSRPEWYDFAKSAVEFCTCLVLLVLAAPVIFLAAALVKLTSRGPAFYTQTRLGQGGRPYTIYKLRSMCHNCERYSGARWSTAGDPRVTPLGRWLRRSHIDELPQLWNVVRGEMSLIGPRPERPEFIPHLEECLPLYHLRRAVRPGVTGLAQVLLPPDTDLESVRRKLAHDLYYVQNYSLWLDLQLLFTTAIFLMGVPYSAIGKFFLLPSSDAIEEAYRKLNAGYATVSQADSAVTTQTAAGVDVNMATCA
jgi:lipopolysaccharide/colanic/teichoic acid biosynthesis glycosyltransferase